MAQAATIYERVVIAEIERWHVAPVDQGQIVEVAYGAAAEDGMMVRRITDRGDGTVMYQITDAPCLWEPWNEPPMARDWSDLITL
jgi:hypothetical protein